MLTPTPRGALSEAVLSAMRDGVPAAPVWPEAESAEDAALTLWSLYELHYRGFDDVDDALEWQPALLTLRHGLEGDLEARLRERFVAPEIDLDTFADDFFGYVAGHDGPSVAAHVQRQATREQVLELLSVRSIYHLKEADPTAFVVPRLPTGPKAALMELQYDEYGGGNPNRLHSHLWQRGMEEMGLDASYGGYIDDVPLEVLEQNNTMSLFGLHRRFRAAALGHLAAFEATSSMPSRRMAQGLERLDFPREIVDYYLEHVEADAVHEQLAVRTICGRLVELEPDLAEDVFFGAFACLDLEDRFATHMLGRWGVGADADAASEGTAA